MDRRCGTGEMKNPIDLEQNRLHHVMPDQLEVRIARRCAMLARLPLKKLSRQVTSCLSLRSRSHRCEPMNPAPPVTSIRTLVVSCRKVEAIPGFRDQHLRIGRLACASAGSQIALLAGISPELECKARWARSWAEANFESPPHSIGHRSEAEQGLGAIGSWRQGSDLKPGHISSPAARFHFRS